MFSFLATLSDRAKLLISILVFSVTVIAVFLLTSNQVNALVIAGVVLAILLVSHRIWFPESKTQIRLASLILAGSAVGANLYPQILVALIRFFSPTEADRIAADLGNNTSWPVLVFLFLVIVAVNYFSRDTTAMGKHENAIDKDIPDPKYTERLHGVVEALTDDLRTIDNKTNWSMTYFTPLDAEVEMNTKRGNRKRVADLLNAIKKSRERLFLVLGDPGSGKSVALRKLARDLLKETKKTGKIPVYINLKEWVVDEKWSESNPPTFEQLNSFVVKNLKNRDIVTTKFFDKYYDRLYETGRLYFIFDSFDEIPSVLDEKDGSALIHQLSEVLFKFLKGARLESQGVLASRLYRKPTFEFQTNVSLEIRPFEDDKIIQTLRRSNIYNQELATKLFKERPELVPIAKNPFAATLIADYAENNNNRLPANQSEMYRSYIEKTMHDCQDKLEKANIEIETIFTVCTVLAKEMFESYGLELPTNKIRLKYPEYPIDIVVDILRFARIGRGASNDTSKFSFVHRRFAEYFFVQNMLNGNVDVSLDSIPSDSQQRDALVLYCEVADFEKAKSIADYCWREIQRINNPMDLHSIHCLRFLRDAFRGRQECIKEFEDDLAGYLLNQFKENPNLVSAKISAELIGVLSEEKINTVLAQCLSINNTWVGENAIKSCRHIDKLDRNTTQMLSQYFTAINIVEIIKKYNEYKFFLTLSKVFNIYFIYIKLYIVKTIFIFLITVLIVSLLGFDLIYNIIFSYFFILFYNIYFILLDLAAKKTILYSNYRINDLHTSSGLLFLVTSPLSRLDLFEFGVTMIYIIILYLILLMMVFYTPNIYISIKLKINMIEKILEYIKKLFTRFNFIILLVIVAFIPITIAIIYVLNYLEKYIPSLKNGLLLFILIVFIVFLVISIYNNFNKFTKIKTEIKQNKTRKIICDAYGSLNPYFMSQFIRYLEENVKKIEGDWPESNFLNNSSDSNITRLAKLEEKWLGLDR